jgi:tetratricopeptide (TPR) repeat protein
MTNDHLTDEEILKVLFTRGHPEGAGPQQKDEGRVEDQELEQHVEQCERCGKVSEEYRRFMSKLYEFGKAGDPGPKGPCPPPAMWAELVTGLVPQDQALKHLTHAAGCAACAQDLEAAFDAVGESAPVLPELQKYLHTATDQWQREFAQKIAAHELTEPGAVAISQPARSTRPSVSMIRSFFFRPWAIASVAAVAVFAVGVGLFSWLRSDSPDTLIRQAYAQQRTIEMRIPGAGYGPIQVERANGRSLTNSPRPLLEAEVLIKKNLEKTPDDPDFLRQKAEADLLAWNYQLAIETLNHAARIQPNSLPLLMDLATAYSERAEANSSPADYEAGLEYLGQAIRQDPSNSAALFNRAIVYERLRSYDLAVADWEQFLKVEQDPQWRAEGERRLSELRRRKSDKSG